MNTDTGKQRKLKEVISRSIHTMAKTAMPTLFTLLLILLLITSVWEPTTLAEEQPTPAIASAQTWLTLIDAQQYTPSWTSASTQFQNMVSQAQWQQALKAYRSPIGTLISRSHPTIQRSSTVPGFPDGTYIGVIFQSSFTKKASTTETVVLTQEHNGEWKVIGYTIK